MEKEHKLSSTLQEETHQHDNPKNLKTFEQKYINKLFVLKETSYNPLHPLEKKDKSRQDQPLKSFQFVSSNIFFQKSSLFSKFLRIFHPFNLTSLPNPGLFSCFQAVRGCSPSTCWTPTSTCAAPRWRPPCGCCCRRRPTRR